MEAKNQVKPWLLLFYNFITDFLSFELDETLNDPLVFYTQSFLSKKHEIISKNCLKVTTPGRIRTHAASLSGKTP